MVPFVKQHIIASRVEFLPPPASQRSRQLRHAMLGNQAADRRLVIDPRRKELILGLERVRWQADTSGNSCRISTSPLRCAAHK